MSAAPRRARAIAALALIFATPAALAVTADDHRGYYLGGFAAYEFADSSRQSDNGLGFQATLGRALGAQTALEFSVLGLRRDRDIDGRGDYQTVFSLDYVRDFGLQGFGGAPLPAFKPYLLGSLGGVLEDVRGEQHLHPALNLGGGLLWPLRIGGWDAGWALRTEVKALIQYNDRQSEPANDTWLTDVHLLVGLSVPLFRAAAPVEAPKAADCPLSVVDPVTGRRDCLSDSDHDGIADAADQCPATPSGDTVDARGCTATGAGDRDADGVADADDRCGATLAGLSVDGQGCAAEQDFALPGVVFESDSAVLTAAATRVLDGVSAMLGSQPAARLAIAGHTDDSGAEGYNLILSRQRAEAVRQYLIARGVEAGRLAAEGHGETQPVAGNDSEAGKTANRRVAFRLLPAVEAAP